MISTTHTHQSPWMRLGSLAGKKSIGYPCCGLLAQSVEHRPFKPRVAGSSPARPTFPPHQAVKAKPVSVPTGTGFALQARAERVAQPQNTRALWAREPPRQARAPTSNLDIPTHRNRSACETAASRTWAPSTTTGPFSATSREREEKNRATRANPYSARLSGHKARRAAFARSCVRSISRMRLNWPCAFTLRPNSA